MRKKLLYEKAAHKILVKLDNQDKSPAMFCRQVAALVTNIFCNFHLVKMYKSANNSNTAEAGEIISADLEFLQFLKKMSI
jgi:hypothetical protein